MLIGLSHIMNCFWIWLGRHTLRYYSDSWFKIYDGLEPSNFDIYVQGMFFITTAITTVGFGDSIATFSVLEQFYQMFIEVYYPPASFSLTRAFPRCSGLV